MRRLLTISALFALALALTATGQPPATTSRPKAAEEKTGDKKAQKKAEKKPDATDAAIAAALANDPDVKMAHAKIQLAEAELAKARQAVTIKVVMLKAKMEHFKLDVNRTEKRYLVVKKAFEQGSGSSADLLDAQSAYEAANAAVAVAEAEWKLLTGSGPGAGLNAGAPHEKTVASALLWLGAQQNARDPEAAAAFLQYLHASGTAGPREAVKGPVADRIRAALDKPVKLAEKGQFVNFQGAVEAFKKAGIDIPFRQRVNLETITSEGEELPVGAWLQLFLDSNRGQVMVVREYGILVVDKSEAPPDAIGVMDFWKQKPPAKEPKAETTTGKR